MKRVVIESPLGSRVDGTRASAEEFARNQRYVLRAMRHSLERGEAPFASHALYPLVLNDATPEERKQGMQAGFEWGRMADTCVVYADHGVTQGMKAGIERARMHNVPVEHRYIGEEPIEEGPVRFKVDGV